MPEKDPSLTELHELLCIDFPSALKVHSDYETKIAPHGSENPRTVSKFWVTAMLYCVQNSVQAAIIVNDLTEDVLNAVPQIETIVSQLISGIEVESSWSWDERMQPWSSKSAVFTHLLFCYCHTCSIDPAKAKAVAQSHGLKFQLRDDEFRRRKLDALTPKVFVCHDHADKETVVRPVVDELHRRMVHTWYDDFSLKIGDSLLSAIEKGLSTCQFACVIVSPSFIKNFGWPRAEFEMAFGKQLSSGVKVLLPIWHNVSKKDVLEYSQFLGTIFALDSTLGPKVIAEKISREVDAKDVEKHGA